MLVISLLGLLLLQRDETGAEHVIQYISCTFNETQQRWPIVEREAYAIVWAITTFRPYLLGLHFTVRTDNSAQPLFEQLVSQSFSDGALL